MITMPGEKIPRPAAARIITGLSERQNVLFPMPSDKTLNRGEISGVASSSGRLLTDPAMFQKQDSITYRGQPVIMCRDYDKRATAASVVHQQSADFLGN